MDVDVEEYIYSKIYSMDVDVDVEKRAKRFDINDGKKQKRSL